MIGERGSEVKTRPVLDEHHSLLTEDERELLEARWRVGEIAVGDLHEVADELLASGEDAPALIELFALDRDELRWSGSDVFERLLRD